MWPVVVEAVQTLDSDEWAQFTGDLRRDWSFLTGKGGVGSEAEGPWRSLPRDEWSVEEAKEFADKAYRRVVEVRGPVEFIYVDPEGTSSAKYVGLPHWPGLEASLALTAKVDVVLSLNYDPDMDDSKLELTNVKARLSPMSAESLDSGRYHPTGKFCAYCEKRRGDEGVCQHCELACGDPCSRCDTGHGPDKHCPCCAPCAVEVLSISCQGTKTGRLSSAAGPYYSNVPKATAAQTPLTPSTLCERARKAVDEGVMSLEEAIKVNGLIAAGLVDPFAPDATADW